ncbi:MAG: MgtC/SapB family protein [Gammaproteobacteria bacterium]
MSLPDIDWALVGGHLVYLGIAYVLALPIAWNREKGARSAGLRTFPLVSMAACGYMLTGLEVLTSTDAESRVLYGIITGMGFIGGGAILKTGGTVTGTATAASLWNTGAIGIAVAFNRFEIALCLSVLNFATLQLVPPLKHLGDDEDS